MSQNRPGGSQPRRRRQQRKQLPRSSGISKNVPRPLAMPAAAITVQSTTPTATYVHKCLYRLNLNSQFIGQNNQNILFWYPAYMPNSSHLKSAYSLSASAQSSAITVRQLCFQLGAPFATTDGAGGSASVGDVTGQLAACMPGMTSTLGRARVVNASLKVRLDGLKTGQWVVKYLNSSAEYSLTLEQLRADLFGVTPGNFMAPTTQSLVVRPQVVNTPVLGAWIDTPGASAVSSTATQPYGLVALTLMGAGWSTSSQIPPVLELTSEVSVQYELDAAYAHMATATPQVPLSTWSATVQQVASASPVTYGGGAG